MSFWNLRRHLTNSSRQDSLPSFRTDPSLPPSYQSRPRSLFHPNANTHPFRASTFLNRNSIASEFPVGTDLGAGSGPESVSTGGPTIARRPKVYVYYRVFTTPHGAIPTKQPVDRRNQYLGRIEAVQVTPPHTVGSLIRCICKCEGVARFRFARLFLSQSSPNPMDRLEHTAILSGSGPGSDHRRPLALVLGDDSDVYRKVIMARVAAVPSANQDASWLSYRAGEILYTDGVVQRKATKLRKSPTTNSSQPTYRVRDANGKTGMVPIRDFSKPSKT